MFFFLRVDFAVSLFHQAAGGALVDCIDQRAGRGASPALFLGLQTPEEATSLLRSPSLSQMPLLSSQPPNHQPRPLGRPGRMDRSQSRPWGWAGCLASRASLATLATIVPVLATHE